MSPQNQMKNGDSNANKPGNESFQRSFSNSDFKDYAKKKNDLIRKTDGLEIQFDYKKDKENVLQVQLE